MSRQIEGALAQSAQILLDFEAVSEEHGLGREERMKLALILVGTDRRNTSLWRLATQLRHASLTVGGFGSFDPLIEVFLRRKVRIGRIEAALFSFLLGMDSYAHFPAVAAACDPLLSPRGKDDVLIRDATNAMARALDAYRREHLPLDSMRQSFTEIRRYLDTKDGAAGYPGPGDVLRFWQQHGSRETGRWIEYSTCLTGMMNFLQDYEAQSSAASGKSMSEKSDTEDGEGTSIADRLASTSEDIEDTSHSPELLYPLPPSEGFEAVIEALTEIETAGTAAFQKVQIELLAKLARYGRFALIWPQDILIDLAFSGCQQKVIQNLRDLNRARRTDDASLADRALAGMREGLASLTASTYEDVVDQLDEVVRHASDVYQWILCNRHPGDPESSPEPSIIPLEVSRRLAPMWKRKGFAGRDGADIRAELSKLEEPLDKIVPRLGAIARALRNQVGKGDEGQFQQNRADFAAKLDALYGQEIR
ncbi:hypothetical protein GEU84_020325 [Fertoebacter nigrum]|uniref:Uncharacterized protein n=1 Tax=Fertoeibacter niger TaxID=2656921 RepID=A0A8X8GYP6_9RHOB|nr:hypothetical protein [Fertoeibacter niger]NUB46743.1 hypothetical protein [Fertoeibacter niger]